MLLRYSCKTWQQKSVDRDTSNEGPMLEAGTEIEVTLRIKLPRPATEAEVEEWLRFELNDNGHMQMANPLSEQMVEPIFPNGFGWQVR
jgi:hypothetical protein